MKKSFVVLSLGFVALLTLFVVTTQVIPAMPMHFRRANAADNGLRDGDIIFQTSVSSQSKAIQLATNSKYSHMGIIYKTDGEYYVFEAVQPVKLTRLDEWIKRGAGSHYGVKRLKDSDKLLTETNVKRMKHVADNFKGRSYDIHFEWSDDKLYCSELVWKIYKHALDIEIGALQELKDFNITNELVRAKMKERYGDEIPLQEKVISPAAMFNSADLVMVREN